ncbi:MAG: polyribonucleotide nucleotidyltransferase [Candidatus Omnitrophica bacterium CG1_02_49_16]|nr:MAG: polyribonucleotide nucleotidyltransferase [Candidatus Omnitrophica bacterium CG1_02_49_16]
MMKKFEVTQGNKPLILETGRLAKQADGSILVQYGGTVVLVAVCGSKKPKEGIDYFPLMVDYQEKSYAGGKIPGGYFKREGKATEKETLTSRLIDRPLRPLFPEGFHNEVQVTATVLSTDKENNSDIPALNAASAALMISGIPFLGPVAAARVGDVAGKFILNPSYKELESSALDIVIAATERGIIMIEAGANAVPENRIVEALEFAVAALKPVLKLQREMAETCGKPSMEAALVTLPEALIKKVSNLSAEGIDKINREEKTKESRDGALKVLCESAVSALASEGSEITASQVQEAFHGIEKTAVRKYILDNQIRTDGRKLDEIRAITCEIGVLPRAHGSALFTRGQTQSLGAATLGTDRDEQMIDAIEGNVYKHFMLHYNFPAFSVGEIKPNRGPGRREIGHGALAERGLRPVLPTQEAFPYTIRLVSEILESNGSSSMASVCSGTLALMDAGVPIKAPVSGIAMGLVKENDRIAILSDIAGVEDHLGDMDFKVTGTAEGVTAVQLDLKLKDSIDTGTLRKALEQARLGRLFILKKMLAVISSPKKDISSYAPRITTIKIDPDKIREIIGPGGKMIRKITAESGASIEVEDDGTVRIASSENVSTEKAIQMINGITEDAEVGKIYKAVVKRIMNFGAFCEILPGKEGLVHVSELSDTFVDKVENVVKIGDEILVKVIEIDSQGRINLSKKQSNSDAPPVVAKRSEPRRGEDNKTFHQKKF